MGMQHVAAQASPIDRKTGLPQLGSEFCGLFMWGRGREGQLGVGTHQDNSVPKMVDELKGRRVLQVCASNCLAGLVFQYLFLLVHLGAEDWLHSKLQNCQH